jgi:hypothetical protein
VAEESKETSQKSATSGTSLEEERRRFGADGTQRPAVPSDKPHTPDPARETEENVDAGSGEATTIGGSGEAGSYGATESSQGSDDVQRSAS